MNDLFISPEEIMNEALEIEKEGATLALKLSLLSQKIKYIFPKIASSPSIESADSYFNLLENIQGILARLAYEHDLGLPDRLHRFVQDFDNLDHYKDHLFQEIKGGKYLF